MKLFNRITAVLILLLNVYFLPFTFITIKEKGGPMAFGLINLPFTLAINLLVISAVLIFTKKHEKNLWLSFVNFIGLCFAAFLFFLLISTPRMD